MTTTSGSTRPAARAGNRARRARRSGSSRGRRSAARRAGASRAPRQLGQPVGPGAGVRAAVPRAQAAGSVSRWSAPQSITRTSSPSCAASSAERPCGRARKTTSCPASVSGGRLLQDAVGERQQVRLVRAQRGARAAARRQRADLRPPDARAAAGAARPPRIRSLPPPRPACGRLCTERASTYDTGVAGRADRRVVADTVPRPDRPLRAGRSPGRGSRGGSGNHRAGLCSVRRSLFRMDRHSARIRPCDSSLASLHRRSGFTVQEVTSMRIPAPFPLPSPRSAVASPFRERHSPMPRCRRRSEPVAIPSRACVRLRHDSGCRQVCRHCPRHSR